jgi:hypothetical protein
MFQSRSVSFLPFFSATSSSALLSALFDVSGVSVGRNILKTEFDKSFRFFSFRSAAKLRFATVSPLDDRR